MLLLKLTLVVLISEIGERTMCSDSGRATSAKENEEGLKTLPQQSLINETSDGCTRQVLPYFEEETGGGVLTVNCTKVCPEGKKETDVNGNPCVATVEALSKEEVTVTVGTCDKGSCKPDNPPQSRTVALITEEEEEEGEGEGEEEEEEEE
uniref:Evasin n=1 Tax=Ixodes ricinus TaxID=34613 RepID=A0A0K8R3E8_IXORI